MRFLKYPINNVLQQAVWHAGHFKVVTRHEHGNRDLLGIATLDDFRFVTLSRKVLDTVPPLSWRLSFVETPTGSLGLAVLFDRGPDSSDRHSVIDLDTGRVTEPILLGGDSPYRSLPRSRDLRLDLARDDKWVVMSGSAARVVGHAITGPTAYADGVHLPPVHKKADGYVVVYRRGGSARTLKVPGRFVVTHVCIAPDGLTALAAGNRSAVLLDLE